MPMIQTVRGPIEAAELGVCYGHEHLLGGPPEPSPDEMDFVLNDEDAAAFEMRSFRRVGGSAVVEMTTPDYGRDVAGLYRISERADVHIVCAAGYNKDPFSAPFVDGVSVGELTERFVREIVEGIDDAGIRAGLVKASSTLDEISPVAEKVFLAAARAHLRTGAPISTHTEAGTMALEQVRLLESAGVDPRRVVIGHMDRKLDLSYHLEVASTGAFLGYDQIGKVQYYLDRERAEAIAHLIDAGYGSQILLGGDLARRSYWPAWGHAEGPGFAYLLEGFVPRLQEVGVSDAAVGDLLITNPARAFAFSEPETPSVSTSRSLQ